MQHSESTPLHPEYPIRERIRIIYLSLDNLWSCVYIVHLDEWDFFRPGCDGKLTCFARFNYATTDVDCARTTERDSREGNSPDIDWCTDRCLEPRVAEGNRVTTFVLWDRVGDRHREACNEDKMELHFVEGRVWNRVMK